MNGDDMLGLALEITSWLAFALFALVGVLALVSRGEARRWRSAHGYVIDDEGQTVLRWFHGSGSRACEAELTPAQLAHLDGAAEADLFYRARRPSRIRFDQPRSHARALGFVALGFLVIGVGTSVAQLVLMAS
ncbi:hypothetical protein ACSAGD_02850 [Paramicrobacterium sp. CJ85]|uniref:hypothetical protein n=1 Tax=Paramicrobacterium sp. CJ85 TaxID=3445355 RepID=UPI003F5EE4C7